MHILNLWIFTDHIEQSIGSASTTNQAESYADFECKFIIHFHENLN